MYIIQMLPFPCGNKTIRNNETVTSNMVRWQHGNEIEESHPLLPALQWDVTRTGAKSHQPANGDRLISSQAPDLQFSLLSNLPPH